MTLTLHIVSISLLIEAIDYTPLFSDFLCQIKHDTWLFKIIMKSIMCEFAYIRMHVSIVRIWGCI